MLLPVGDRWASTTGGPISEIRTRLPALPGTAAKQTEARKRVAGAAVSDRSWELRYAV